MEDLLQSQIQDSCRLALPNGLKELMNDVSREVLRAQPQELFKFITDYLSTLLITREHLYIAARVCNVVCDCDCRPELEDELRQIGLDENDASEASEFIEEFLRTNEVNEGSLLLKLVKKTSIDESILPAVLSAVRRAFLRHQKNHTQINETCSDSDKDEPERAVRHTLGIYRKTEPTNETFNCMAQKIQASYRAYKVRREKGTVSVESDGLLETLSDSSIRSIDQVTRSTDHLTPSRAENLERAKVTFGGFEQANVITGDPALATSKHGDAAQFKHEATLSKPMPSLTRLSSTSLAGSYLSLPQFQPYSAHDSETLEVLEETPEKEHSNYDYTRENSPIDEHYINDMTKEDEEQRDQEILVYESPEENSVNEEDIGEDIVEDIVRIDDDVKFIEDNIVEQIVMGNDEGIPDKDEAEDERDITDDHIIWKMGTVDECTVEEDIVVEEGTTDGVIVDDIVDDIFEEDEDDNFGDVTGSY